MPRGWREPTRNVPQQAVAVRPPICSQHPRRCPVRRLQAGSLSVGPCLSLAPPRAPFPGWAPHPFFGRESSDPRRTGAAMRHRSSVTVRLRCQPPSRNGDDGLARPCERMHAHATVLLFGSQTYASRLPPVFNSNPHPLVSAPIVQPHAVPIRQALVQLQRPTG